MTDKLGFIKDDKLMTGQVNKVLEFIKKYSTGYTSEITPNELESADMIEIHTCDGLKLSIEQD